MANSLRVVFMGTPDFAVPALQAILAVGHDVIAVYTRAPKAKGRGQVIQKSPIHNLAEAHTIPVYTPASFRKDPAAAVAFAALKPDVAVVAAYGLILTPEVLSAPKYGCINIHASLLPRWRGASPIHHAIWHGDVETGVTIMHMDEGLDTGAMITDDRVLITPDTTTPMMTDVLARMGARLVIRTLDDLVLSGHVHKTVQPQQGVTLAPLLKKENGLVDWREPAALVHCQVRGLMPWPGTYTCNATGQDFKILAAVPVGANTDRQPGTLLDRDGHIACGAGTVLQVMQIQVPTGKKMDIASAINGGYVQVGEVFG